MVVVMDPELEDGTNFKIYEDGERWPLKHARISKTQPGTLPKYDGFARIDRDSDDKTPPSISRDPYEVILETDEGERFECKVRIMEEEVSSGRLEFSLDFLEEL
jgi:hypothetical protein